jgi:hypothetical protein
LLTKNIKILKYYFFLLFDILQCPRRGQKQQKQRKLALTRQRQSALTEQNSNIFLSLAQLSHSVSANLR